MIPIRRRQPDSTKPLHTPVPGQLCNLDNAAAHHNGPDRNAPEPYRNVAQENRYRGPRGRSAIAVANAAVAVRAPIHAASRCPPRYRNHTATRATKPTAAKTWLPRTVSHPCTPVERAVGENPRPATYLRSRPWCAPRSAPWQTTDRAELLPVVALKAGAAKPISVMASPVGARQDVVDWATHVFHGRLLRFDAAGLSTRRWHGSIDPTYTADYRRGRPVRRRACS